MAVAFVYVAYFALNVYHTPALDSLSCITDTQGHLLSNSGAASSKAYTVSVKIEHDKIDMDQDYIPPLYDLPVSLINRAVFDEG